MMAQQLDTMPPMAIHLELSPHYPLLVTGSDRAPGQVIDGSAHPSVCVPVNGPIIPIETQLFAGHMCLHARGLSSSNQELFRGKRRSMWYSFQGRFKRPVPVNDLYTGQEFFILESETSPLPIPLVKVLLRAAASTSSARVKVEVTSTYFCALSLLAASCQVLNVSRPGEQPDILHAHEDARLLSPRLADVNGKPVAAAKRRKLMDKPSFTAGMVLGTEHVYTFVSWMHHVDLLKLEADLGGWVAFDLARWLPPNRPVVLMTRDIKSGHYMRNLSVWHPKLLVKLHEEQAQEEERQQEQ